MLYGFYICVFDISRFTDKTKTLFQCGCHNDHFNVYTFIYLQMFYSNEMDLGKIYFNFTSIQIIRTQIQFSILFIQC